MLAVLLLNNIAMRKRNAKKQKVIKPIRIEKKIPVILYCRTCLSTQDLVSIFISKDTEKKRTEDLKLVTGLDIRMDDGLSQKMCMKCLDLMNTALQFRRTSRKAEKTLLNMVSGRKPKKKYNTRLQKKVYKDKKVTKSQPDIKDNDVHYEVYDNGFQNDDSHNYSDDYQAGIVNDFDDLTKKDVKPKFKQKQTTGTKKKRCMIPNAASYKCTTCSKEFRMKATYKAHMRFHTNYCVCESCGKRCRNNNQLQEHKRARHGLGRIHTCAYCDYSSATKEALTIHERRHTGERPYVCDHCGATFHRRSNLVQHIAIHLPDKNFQCDLCPKRLKSRKFLQIHKHNAHTGRRYGYLCPVCDHRFEKPNKVRAHTRRVHGLPDDQQGPIARVQL
ncbi:GDNF-inducible zinc finger protein 1-like [Galleria mellonella]|uniref:GDNF-inducible zinc finger protein 1-like n=1 Tax=Galleria mellonella TaxID=7137 RepID=A0ABM3MWC7_GALME|nr:GDNF-inducible zinc finger protein 1-like [Galleria mellonella]